MSEARHRRPRLTLETIDPWDESEIKPPRGGVTVIVGANNAGKSTFLREIFEQAKAEDRTSRPKGHIIANCDLRVEGTYDDLVATLKDEGAYFSRDPNTKGYKVSGQLIPEARLPHNWRAVADLYSNSLGQLAQYFIYYVNATNRTAGISPAPRRPDIADPPESPMHLLEDNPEMLEMIRSICRKVFRQTLTLDRLSNNVQLRVGETNVPAPPIDNVTREYRDSLVALEPLQGQGDGMTALLGLLVPIICGNHNVALIDEPEAFLHPPQARMVGTILGELAAQRDMQVLVATHDRNILIGLLESRAPVSVIRLDRRAPSTRIHRLDYLRVRELWDDPVLRYSNLLDGLFHHVVVLCEAERDCTFYAASLDIASGSSELDFAPGDVLFIPSGGKDGFPGMVKALKAVSVPVVTVPDIDALNDKNKIRLLVDAMGGDWNLLESSYNIATEQFRHPRQRIANGQILQAVRAALTPILDEVYTRETEELVKAAMRSAPSPWEDLKRYGINAWRGQARGEASKMIAQLQELGIVLVKAGELENLAPSVQSKKGKQWLREALEKEAFRLEPAQSHIRDVIEAIHSLLREGVAADDADVDE